MYVISFLGMCCVEHGVLEYVRTTGTRVRAVLINACISGYSGSVHVYEGSFILIM